MNCKSLLSKEKCEKNIKLSSAEIFNPAYQALRILINFSLIDKAGSRDEWCLFPNVYNDFFKTMLHVNSVVARVGCQF